MVDSPIAIGMLLQYLCLYFATVSYSYATVFETWLISIQAVALAFTLLQQYLANYVC